MGQHIEPDWRTFLCGLAAIGAGMALGACPENERVLAAAEELRKPAPGRPKAPLIDTTDLYHPPQDPGDTLSPVFLIVLSG